MAITVYGAGWCGDTRRTRAQLDALGLSYAYHDVDADPAADAWVRAQNAGARKLPTVEVGGLILSVPGEGELDAAIQAAEAAM